MNYLIITCHPYKGSFNAAAADRIEKAAKAKGHAVRRIDLVEDGFDPVMSPENLRQWGAGQPSDRLIDSYQKAITEAEMLIFPFPVWWGAMPAILKGFCDKVLLPGFAYKYGAAGEMIGMLTAKKAIVITTMETPLSVFVDHFNNPVEGAFIKDTLQTCGIEVSSFMQIDRIVSGGREHSEEKLKEIEALI